MKEERTEIILLVVQQSILLNNVWLFQNKKFGARLFLSTIA